MARPARLFPRPGATHLINVNRITMINVSGTTLTIFFDRVTSEEQIQQVFPTPEEAEAAAEVWRARVDDAP